MSAQALAEHLEHPLGRAHTPRGAHTGAAGSATCGDVVRVSLSLVPGHPEGLIADAGFDAAGCGATIAAGSAVVALVRGRGLLSAARLGAADIAEELGGLMASKLHAAALAADALHRALGHAARQTQLAPTPGRALVAMSGGVDSAVAALLVAHGGTEAIAVTLELWSDPDNDGERSCCSPQAVRGARALAHDLGLPHFSLDLRREFRAGVVDPWLADHAAGETPNPCVRCNGQVRLDGMLSFADRLGARTLVTGHYARTHHDSVPPRAALPHDSVPPRAALPRDTDATDDASFGAPAVPLLRAAVDPAKDQSYMLAALAPATLARLRFPLGSLTKAQVRARAEQAGLAVAHKPDSQDLCFLAGTGKAAFLARHGGQGERPGPIVDRRGHRLGSHRGHQGFTVGQRRGLGLGGGEPLYVLGTDAADNVVTVGPRDALIHHEVRVRDVTLHAGGACVDRVRLRYRGAALPCRSLPDRARGAHEELTLHLRGPSGAVAPGQLACLMSGELVVGHATVAAWPPPRPSMARATGRTGDR